VRHTRFVAKRPLDPNELAKLIVDLAAAGEAEDLVS